MEQSPSWGANSHSASQEIPRFFMEPEVLLHCLKKNTIDPYPEQYASSPQIITLFP
jgi:hypothetical protein